jgi:hypothetical protein
MQYRRIAPEPFDLYTGGKQPELAIAFNQACDNMEKYINTLAPELPLAVNLSRAQELDDRAFVYLRQYLWKGHGENKNTAGYALEPVDKEIILLLLEKLVELRNFHSHYWHEPSALEFDGRLRLFIQEKHDRACGQLLEVRSVDAELYFKQQERYPLFREGRYIAQEGRVFFLSLFLNKGQMQHLLQRRKGSKRHDLPEYRFKHKLFTFYCHREGSAWGSTGIANTMLPTLDPGERQRIFAGRQANRVLSYLKDRPAIGDKEALPLILANGLRVIGMTSLIAFILEKNLLPGFQFMEKQRPLRDGTDAEARHREQIEREEYRHFMLPEDKAYEFRISHGVLRRIVTEIFLDDHDPKRGPDSFSNRDHFIGVLSDCIGTRRYVYESLSAEGDHPLTPEIFVLKKKYSSIYIDYAKHEGAMQERYYTGDEWRSIPVSPTLRVEKLLIEWHQSFTMGKEGEPGQRVKLLNAIRPKTEAPRVSFPTGRAGNRNRRPEPIRINEEPEPLLFHLAYYYREQGANMRTEDRFLEWGVRYLMDQGLVPDWHFELEQLVYEQKFNEPESPYKLKKEARWEKAIPENYRLYITDNQLNVGIYKGNRFYRLRMGERALKYLLHWHFHELDKQGKSINEWLLRVTDDLSLVQGGEGMAELGDLMLLEDFAIPPLYFKTKVRREELSSSAEGTLKDQSRRFFEERIGWIDAQLADMRRLNRSQKNEMLMDAYQLFDFTPTEGSKFLRKNEYGQMSICHYMMNQDKDKVRHLIERTFRLKKRLPQELLQLVYRVAGQEGSGLDDLCREVLENRRRFLLERLSLLNLPGLKARQIRKEVVGSLAIRFGDEVLSEEELGVRRAARLDSVSHIPFAVHPALALKYFYPEEFAVKGFCKEGGKYRNIFLLLRSNTVLTNPLPEENYREVAYQKALGDYAVRFPDDGGVDRSLDKWTGWVNDNKVKDILLLEIAGNYLEQYDPMIAEGFKRVQHLKKINLEQLFGTPAVVQLKMDQSLTFEIDTKHKTLLPRVIHLQLRMHQLDDYFYRSQKPNLLRLAVFYLLWREEELDRYKDHLEILTQLSKWPDGSPTYPLTIASLIEARKICADQAAELVGYLFSYEAEVLQDHLGMADKSGKQAALMTYSGTHERGTYISFKSILGWNVQNTTDTKDKLDKLRYDCIHNTIPVNGSYRQLCYPGTGLADVLHIQEPIGRDRTEKNIYEVLEEREVGSQKKGHSVS